MPSKRNRDAKRRSRRNRWRDENRRLKRWFDDRGLDLSEVWIPTPGDPEVENRQLRLLQMWVDAYLTFGDRRELEDRGFRYPPIEPDFDPDSDWARFERWIRGEPLSWSYVEQFGPLPEPAGLSDDQLEETLREITNRLERRNVILMIHQGVPPRLVFRFLRRELEETRFEFLCPTGTFWLDGCDGDCPSCFQRPWCEVGREPGWPEDEREGCVVIPPEVEPYITETTYRAAS